MRTLEEITEALEPEAVRTALKAKLTQVNNMIAERVVDRQVEERNPNLSAEVKRELLRQLAEQITGLDQIRADIEERLSDAEGALKAFKPNRGARRRAERNGVKA